jgi:hypothetical protein
MTLVSAEFLRKIEKLGPDLKDVLYPIVETVEKHYEESVGRIEFNDLKDIVKDLAEAQKRTEIRVEELAEAQKRTEKKLAELTEVVKTLAKDQKNMAKDQKEMAAAQKKMAYSQQGKMQEELGGLGTTVGYTLENEAYKQLPALLEKDFGIRVKQRILRKYVQGNKGKPIEVNIFGHGEKDGKDVTIIGEAKAQLSNNKIDDFLRKKVKHLEGLFEEVFLVLVTHMITGPGVEGYAKEKKISLYYSYDF